MLTPSRHLLLPLVFPRVRASLIFTRLFHVPDLWLRIFPFTWLDSPILTADCSIHSPNLDTPILTTDIWIWNGAHGGCDRSAEDAHSFATPDPTFAFVGGPCCPTLDFAIAFWIMTAFYTLLTSLFCIKKPLFAESSCILRSKLNYISEDYWLCSVDIQ
jgi:hypothetical protein